MAVLLPLSKADLISGDVNSKKQTINYVSTEKGMQLYQKLKSLGFYKPEAKQAAIVGLPYGMKPPHDIVHLIASLEV